MGVLNPNYESQGDRPLTLLLGYGMGSGDQVFPFTDAANNQYAFAIIGDGECDGIEQFSHMASMPLFKINPGWLYRGIFLDSAYFFPNNVNFHAGRWTPIGLPNLTTSVGPDQGFDEFFAQIPSITPPQSLSNMAYAAFKLIPGTALPSIRGAASVQAEPIAAFGIFRGARVRYFDEYGNVTGYGFSTCPTWQIMEVILRYMVKRQQPQIAGLTDAEKALFDWPSIVAHAQRCDYVLANGFPRFMSNVYFAATATLASILETLLRVCRSYIDVQNGKIGIYGHDPTDSAFTMTSNHIMPGTLNVEKKNVKGAPNQFVPKYRELGVPAVISVTNMNSNNAGATEGSRTIISGPFTSYFNTGGDSPFSSGQFFYYGDGDNPAATGDYIAQGNVDPSVATPLIMASGPNAALSSNGGYIGTHNSRFKPYAPNTINHRRHQAAAGLIAAGIPGLPTVKPVTYDLGNMTYDQADRLMQYERDQSLGNDVDGWTVPRTGTVRVRMEAVDASGRAFDQMRPGEAKGRFTITEDMSVEYQGEYFITALTPIPPAKGKLGFFDVEFRSYNPDGYTDISNPPDDTMRVIASAKLTKLGMSEQLANVSWTLQATVSTCLAGDGTMKIVIADLTLQKLGGIGFATYPFATWTDLTSGTQYLLYVDDPGGGTAPTFGALTGVTALPAGSPAYRLKVLSGVFSAAIGDTCSGGGSGAEVTLNFTTHVVTHEIYVTLTGAVTIGSGGSGYVHPTGLIVGQLFPSGATVSYPCGIVVTAGAVTGVTGVDTSIKWIVAPELYISS